MSIFIITDGITTIESIYAGQSPDEAVNNGRELIDGWPEYAAMDNEEIIELALAEDTEFDLVEINEPWPNKPLDREDMIKLYEEHMG